MVGREVITLVLLITGCVVNEVSSEENENLTTTITKTSKNVTNDVSDFGTKLDVVSSTTESSISSTTTTTATTTTTTETIPTIEPFPLFEEFELAESASIEPERKNRNEKGDNNGNHSDDEKNTAKRTISSRFTGPIVVGDDVKLYTPVDDSFRKQINVQIIEPDRHNNGQFLKQTVFVRQENSTTVSSKTTTTTERPARRKNIVIEQRGREFVTPFHVGGVRVNGVSERQKQNSDDEDCDDPSTERPNVIVQQGRDKKLLENIEIQQNTKVKKVSYQDDSRQNIPYGTRFTTTTKTPCDQALPCSTTPRLYRPAIKVTPRLKTIVNTPPYLPPRIVTTPVSVVTSTVTPIPLRTTTVVPKPIYIHTHTEVPVDRIVEKHVPVPVEKVVKQFIPVHHPVVTTATPVTVRPTIVHKPIYIHTRTEVPVEKIVEKPVEKYIKQIVPVPQPVVTERIVPVEVEKLVVKEVKVPYNNIIEKHVQHPPTVIEKFVPYPVHTVIPSRPIEIEKVVTKEVRVPVDRIVEKEVPYQVDHIVEKIVDRPVHVEKIVEKPVAVPYVVEKFIDRHIPIQVGIPVHVPYYLPIEVPVHSHVPYPVHVPYLVKPTPTKHYIIKTTKYGKGHGLFDWKHKHQQHVKHVVFKKPSNIILDELLAPPTIDSIGLLPPPRFQPYISENFGPKASESINVARSVLPGSSYNRNRDQPQYEPTPLKNGFGNNYENKYKFVDSSFSKDIRWEFGFKPPLVPSVAIDEFGNPLNESS